jgi:hypothetical protein
LYSNGPLRVWRPYELLAFRWYAAVCGRIKRQNVHAESPLRRELFLFMTTAWGQSSAGDARDRLKEMRPAFRLPALRFASFFVPGFAIKRLAGRSWSPTTGVSRFVALRCPA